MTTHRLIHTGIRPNGQSHIKSDAAIPQADMGNFNFWHPNAEDGAFPFYPDDGENLFRFFEIPPETGELSTADFEAMVAGFFEGIGDPTAKVDNTRHPLMHRTQTTDYIVLLSGRVSLLLDQGDPVELKPFDAVVQHGTNHAWVNTGNDPALLMAVMIGVKAG